MTSHPATRSLATVRSALSEAMEEQLAAGAPGVILAVDAPRLDVSLRLARGRFQRDAPSRLQPCHAFRAASVTKAVTAATAVSLAASGKWDLDAPVARFLPGALARKLRSLDGLDSLDALTIRRLLDHTSGLPDYFFDPAFQERVRARPDHTWAPQELADTALDIGALQFPVGSDFAYGDSGYVLVGLAIERAMSCSLASAYRSLVFDPLGMDSTYLEWHEDPRGPALSHHYEAGTDLRHRNLSFDWAGGGLVTTAQDVIRLLRGLFCGSLLDEPWRAEMMRWNDSLRWRPGSSAHYLRYGLGLGVNRVGGVEIWGATGVWGAFAYFCPDLDAALAGTVNRVGADRAALLDAALTALRTAADAHARTDASTATSGLAGPRVTRARGR